MIRFFKLLLELVCWIQIFLFPVFIFLILGLIVRIVVNHRYEFSILVTFIIVGALLGIVLAEKVRRKTGCSTLIFRKYFSSDIDEITTK
jgi:hypothetical protein